MDVPKSVKPDSRQAGALGAGVQYLRKYLGKIVTALFMLTGLVLTVIQLLPETTQLSYSTTRLALLTEQPAAEGLTSEYYFEDRQIDTLWELDMVLANTGSKTLVGLGESANILGSGITADIPDGFRLLRVDVRRNDPRLDASIERGNRLLLTFGQWRSGEGVELALFIEEFVVAWGSEPSVSFGPRQLVDGDIIHSPAPSVAAGTKVSLFDHFGTALQKALRITCAIALAPFALLFGLFVGMTANDFRTAARSRRGRAAYEAAMAEWLAAHPGLDAKTVADLQRATRRPGLLGISQVIMDSSALTPDDIKTIPRLAGEPMFPSHLSRTIAALIGAALCSAFVVVILELATTI